MEEELKIAGLGMVSTLAIGAELNAAAMRCGYNGFIMQKATSDDHEILPMARTPIDEKIRGNKRLNAMLVMALEEAIRNLPEKISVPLYLCLSQDDKLLTDQDRLPETAYEAIQASSFAHKIDYENTKQFTVGRVSFAYAVQYAEKQLESGKHQYVMVVGVDSLTGTQRYSYYQAQRRVLAQDNPDGFIPGEAAVALLLTQEDIGVTTQILGMSTSNEPHPIDGDKPVTGNGLTDAINQAVEKSGIPVSETDFRISSVSGEAYFFRETAIVHGRTMDNPRQEHPLWHPADHIGEVGAAVGGAMVVMAHYAFEKGYAPGKRALCQLSNDDQHRAAFILERTGSS